AEDRGGHAPRRHLHRRDRAHRVAEPARVLRAVGPPHARRRAPGGRPASPPRGQLRAARTAARRLLGARLMRRTVVLDVVGLTASLLGPHTPNLSALARRGGQRHLGTVLPAVTCSAQSTLLTGAMPREHGVVGNGWYHRDLAEIAFWKQSNHLVAGE